jgi:biopolymer transport protein ExbD
MAEDAGDTITDGRLDLVPMIDCIMPLLIFLILTARFTIQGAST